MEGEDINLNSNYLELHSKLLESQTPLLESLRQVLEYQKMIESTGEFEVYVNQVRVWSKKGGDGDCTKTSVNKIAEKVKA